MRPAHGRLSDTARRRRAHKRDAARRNFGAKENGVRKCLLMNQGCPSHSKIASASSFFEDRSIFFQASSTDSIRLAAPARSFAGISVGQDDVEQTFASCGPA
jgi:hypothetical protein